MKSAKIRLSEEEQVLVSNGDWILTKNRVLQQITAFLGEMQAEQENWLRLRAPALPASILATTAKVSQGENYLGLPYRVLDYPRCFGPADIFALRTIFWWGHFFSVTLQVAGFWKKETEYALKSAFEELRDADGYICTGTDPWQHHFTPDYYRSVRELKRNEWEKIILEQPFIKLATRHALTDWENTGERLLADYALLVRATGYAD